MATMETVADLAVGAHLSDLGGEESGAVYVIPGPVEGDSSLAEAAHVFHGEAAGDRAGYWLAFAGDTDGDARAELVVGAWGVDRGGADAGAAYIVELP